ncbi:ATP-binding protein [Bacillus sp. CRN 9]|nr:ATP-binding protein [Bacillus sp. CRN 9]
MSNTVFLPNGMEATHATYTDFPLQEFNENPLIQALPPLADKQEVINKLLVMPIFQKEERYAAGVYRLHMINRLFQLFQPLPIHIEVWNMIHSLIMQGYLARNPFDKTYKEYLNASGQEIINRTFDINSRKNFRSTAGCGTLIGFSGMGKTTTVNRVLSNIPQVILHNEYRGQHYNQIQLVWLKLEAPSNSSLKSLCLQFFMKVDEILGSNNYRKHVSRNTSVDSMMPLISQLAHNIGLGQLIIDETQNIKQRGSDQIMNFFVSLINSGINLAVIGTPGAYDLFGKELRITRRLTGNAEIIYNNMEYGNEFKLLMETIWQYQWTQKPIQYNEEFASLFYELTQGISDLVVKLFAYSQQVAIQTGKEEITIALIKKVAKEKFKLLNPMLEAIRSGNPYKIAKYEDIRKLEITDTEFVDKVDKQVKVENRRKQTVDKFMDEVKSPIQPPKKKIRRYETYEKGDLRFLLQQGLKADKSPFDVLLENFFIDNMTDWIEEG